MADIDLTAGVSADPASEAALAKAIEAAIERGLKSGLADFTSTFSKIGDKAGKQLGNSLGKGVSGAKKLNDAAREIEDTLSAIVTQSQGVSKTLGKSFDPRSLALVEDQLAKIAVLQSEITANSGNLSKSDQSQLRNQLRGVEASLKLVRTAFQQSAQAAREFDINAGQSARSTSRERIAAINAERSANVVATQRAAANELATIRATAATEVAETRAASRTRVALIELAGRSIVAVERGIRSAFSATASIIGSTFRGIGNVAGAAASSIRGVFQKSNTEIYNSYQSSFSKSTKTVNNELNQQSSAVRNFVSTTTNQLNSLGTVAGGVRGGLGLALGGLLGVGAARALSSGFTRAANLEDAQRAFEILLRDAEKAKELTDAVVKVVTGTPFKLDQFSQAASQLLAFNVQADKIPTILTAIGDAAAVQGGRSGEFVDRLVRTFGQIQTAGKVTTEDLNQIAEAGVPAFAILQNALGVTIDDLRKMITDGVIPANVAIDALVAGIENGSDGIAGVTSSVGGLAQSLGTTLRGTLANFNTAIARLGANVIKAFGPLLVAGVNAATKAIDLLGSAIQSVAAAISNSAAFKVLSDLFVRLGDTIKQAQTTLKPVFDFLAQGVVIVASLAGAFKLIGFLPEILGAIAAGFVAVLSPMNLFIAAAVVVASYLKNLLDGSSALQIALSNVGRAISIAVQPAFDALREIFGAFSSAVGTVAVNTKSLSETIGDFLVKKLIDLATFIRTTVNPAIKSFAAFIHDEVVPRIEEFRAKVGDLASSAFQKVVAYIQDTVIPVVGRGLAVAFDVATKGFNAFYDFASGTLVPFIRSNLIPTIAALAAVIGTIAITGNLPLAGLVAVGGAIGVALANPSIRNALIDNIKQAVETSREFLSNLVDSGTLGKVAVGALKVARKIGEVLGDALSDRRLVAAVGGIVAAGVAVAGSFILGFGQGVIKNIPDLIVLLGEALDLAITGAIKVLISNPKIALALAGILTGGLAINALRSSSIKAGKVIAEGLRTGAAVQAGVTSGNTATDFVRGLFGGPGAIQAAAQKVAAESAATIKRAFQQNQALIQNLTGDVAKGNNGQFLKADAEGLRVSTARLNELRGAYGTAAVAGAQFRLGLQQIGTSIKSLDLQSFKAGIANIGTALKTNGAQLAQAAGIVVGAAFAASFVSRALFDVQSSGAEKLQAGFGLLASGLAASLAFGGPTNAVGLAAGGAAIAVGVLTGKSQASAEASKRAAEAAQGFADALANVKTEADKIDLITTTLSTNIRGASTGIQATLAGAGFSLSQFIDSVQLGTVNEDFGKLNSTFDDIRHAFQGADTGPFIKALVDSGASIDEITTALRFLNSQVDLIGEGTQRNSFFDQINDLADVDLSGIQNQLTATGDLANTLAEAGAAAAQAMEDVKQVEVSRLQGEVDAASEAFNVAQTAAEKARDAVLAFFDAGVAKPFEQQANEAIVSVGNLADTLNQNIAEVGVTAGAQTALTFNNIAQTAADTLKAGFLSGDIVTFADAQAAFDPLIAAAESAGTEGGRLAAQALRDQRDQLKPEDFVNLVAADQGAQTLLSQLKGKLNLGKLKLQDAIDTDASQFDGAREAATEAFKGIADDAIAGFRDTMSSDSTAADASRSWAEGVVIGAQEGLDAHSPSIRFQELGQGAADGFVIGIQAGSAKAIAAATSMARAVIVPFQFLKAQLSIYGVQATAGFAAGIRAGESGVVKAAVGIAKAAADAIKKELEIESPSKATRYLGEQASEGLAQGVRLNTPVVEAAAKEAGVDLLKGMASGIKDNGEIVFNATDIFEEGVTRRFKTVGETIGDAIGFGLAESGPGIVSSVDGIINDIVLAGLSGVEQLQLVGTAISSSLFSRQGTPGFGNELGGGTAVAELQRQFLALPQAIVSGFQESFRKNGAATPTFDINTVAGRDNRDAFLQSGIAIRNYAQALIDAGRPLDSVIYETQQWRDQLIAAAYAQGANTDQINELLGQLGLTNGQLNQFVDSVNAVNAATAAGTAAANAALAAARERAAQEKARIAAEKAAEEAAKKAEEEAKKAEEEAAQKTKAERQKEARPAPIFRDLNMYLPTGDPEANALAVANRIASGAARS